MGLKTTTFIEDCDRRYPILCCKACRTHLLSLAWIIPGHFTGSLGKAHFTAQLVNYKTPTPSETRRLLTGRFLVQDVHCTQCLVKLGWKYLSASSASEQYKVGHYVVEAALLVQVDAGLSLTGYLACELLSRDIAAAGAGLRELNRKTQHLELSEYIEDAPPHEGAAHEDSFYELSTAELAREYCIETSSVVYYADSKRYFEMQKDLLHNSEFSCRFLYYFSKDSLRMDGERLRSLGVTFTQEDGFTLGPVLENSDDEMAPSDEDEMECDEDAKDDGLECIPYFRRQHYRPRSYSSLYREWRGEENEVSEVE